MGTSLYDLSVPIFLQTVKAVGGFLERPADDDVPFRVTLSRHTSDPCPE